MSAPHLLLQRIAYLFLFLGLALLPVSAQQDPHALDPADIFFQAWLTIRDAEKLEKKNEFNEARLKYKQAAKYYDIITKFHANWKPDMVKRRVISTREAIQHVEAAAMAELARNKAKTQDFVEGSPDKPNKSLGSPKGSGHAKTGTSKAQHQDTAKSSTAPKKTEQSTVKDYKQVIIRAQQQQLKNLQRANEKLRAQLEQVKQQNKKHDSAEQQRLIKKIAAKDREIATIRDILARAPLQKDMDELARKNKTISMELSITAMSLKGTMQRLAKAQKEAQKYQEEAAFAKRRAAEIQKTMEIQKASDNKVVRELRKELKNITKTLKNTQVELGKAKAQMAQMQRTLEESKSTIEELTKERDALRTERDSLASILKQNDSAGVRKLITENMRLGKELKETQDRLEYLTKKANASQDELLEAKRDLAVAKTRIIRYQKERTRHSKRILSLESQLRDAEAELASAKNSEDKSVSQEEVEILKATVKRLIAAQERQKTAEKILWDTYQKSKKIIPGIVEAMDDIRKTKVELTEEEKGLIVKRRPDREFTSPERVSPAHAKAFESELEKNISDYNKLVKRFYLKGRYEAARQVLADMDEQFPGHFPTLCNRGVLELKTQHYLEAINIFSEAITMRENSGYAHYMLGLAQYKNNDLDAARNSFSQALDINPDNARAHFYLGNLAGVGHRYKQAEEHFKTAIKLDPTMADAYFNLSVVYLRQKQKTKAIEAYRKALTNGAQPDPAHEKKLGL